MSVRAKTKRRLLILLAAAMFVVVSLATVYVVRMQRLRSYYLGLREQGIAQHKVGDYENAQLNLSRYLRREEHASDAEAIYCFADASQHVERPNGGHIVLAAAQLKRAVELRPHRTDWRRQLLQHYADLRFNSETVETADAILKSVPADKEALSAKARALVALRVPDKALDAAKKGLEADPHDIRMHLLVLELYRDPKNLGALQHDPSNHNASSDVPSAAQEITPSGTILRRAARLLNQNPADGRYHLLMSAACVLAGELSPAQREELLRTVRVYDPDAKEVSASTAATFFARRAAQAEIHGIEHVEALLMHLQRLGLATDALAVAQKAEALNHPPIRQYLVRRLFETDRYAEVDKHLADVRLEPRSASDTELLGMRAAALARLGRKDEVKPILELFRAQGDNKLAEAWAVVIENVYLSENPDHLKVLDAARDALTKHPGSAQMHFFLAESLRVLGERGQAMDAYQQAGQLSPLWARPLMALATLKLEAGSRTDALGAAFMAHRVSPSLLSEINLAVVWAATIQDEDWVRHKDLLNLVTTIQRMVPGEEQTLPVYVRALAATGDRAQAEKITKDALARKKPLSEGTLLRLAAASKQSQLGLEAEVYLAVEQAYGLTSDLALARALDLLAQGKRDEATAFLDQGRQNKPKSEELPWRLAWVRYLEHVQDPRAAAEWAALANDPAYASDLSVQRAVLDARSVQGNKELLAQAVERLRKLTGEHAGAWRVARARLLLKDAVADPTGSESKKLLTEALAASPTDVEARMLLSLALQRSGDTQGAIDQLREGLSANPQSVPARVALAAIHQSQAQFDQAQQHLNLVDAQRLDSAQRHRVAVLYLQQGDLPRAMEVMRQADLDELDAAGASFLAELTWRAGDLQKAQALYEQLAARADVNGEDRLRAGIAYADFLAATGRAAEAEAAAAQLRSLPVPAGVLSSALGDHHARRGDRSKAIEQYRAAVSADPQDAQAWLSLIAQHVRAGKTDDALAAADEAARHLPQSKALSDFRTHAALIRKVGDDRRYIPLIVSMLQGSSEADIAARALRISAEGSGSLEARRQAIQDLRTHIDKSPRFVPALILLAQEYELLGQRKQAAAVAQRATQVAPGSPEVAQIAAMALAASGEYDHARVAAQRWRGLSAGDALAADLFIAQLNLQLSDAAAALRQLAPYTALAAADPDSYRRVIDVQSLALISSRQPDRAADLLWPLTARSPEWRQLWMQRAVMMGSGMPQVAAAWLDRLSSVIAPDAVEEQIAVAGAWYELGTRADDAQHRDRAKRLLDQLVQRHPTSAAVLNTRGMILEQEGDAAGAERDYRRTLELEPKHGIAANNLAMVLARRGGDSLSEALTFAQKAVDAYPRSSTIYDTLAFVQTKLKDYASATASRQMAVRLEPNNPAWRVRLAELYGESGEKDKALRLLQELDAAYPDKSRLDGRLQRQIEALRGWLDGKTAMAPPG